MTDERTDRRERRDRRAEPVTTDLRADRRAGWREERRERRVIAAFATALVLLAPLLLLLGRGSGRDDRTSAVAGGQVAEAGLPPTLAGPPIDTAVEPPAAPTQFGGGAVRRFGEWASGHEGHEDPLRPGEVQPYAAEGIRLLGDALREVALARGLPEAAEGAGALRPLADSLAPGMRRLTQSALVKRAFTRAAAVMGALRAGAPSGTPGAADSASAAGGATVLSSAPPLRAELATLRDDRLLSAQGPAVRALFSAAARELERFAPPPPVSETPGSGTPGGGTPGAAP